MNLKDAIKFQERYEENVEKAATYIRKRVNNTPEFGIVLGSGLGGLVDSIKTQEVIPYQNIPNFPQTTIQGHEGKIIIGTLSGVSIIGLKGRKHYYEVADLPMNVGILQCVFPVHVLANLGIKNYFVTNAAGGLNSNYEVGDLMIIKSHINLLPNPLLGRRLDFRTISGDHIQRFQPMNSAYDPNLRKILKRASSIYGEKIHEGTYLAVTGPSYETESECIAFRDGLKADAVGMSTTIETIVARNREMNVVGFSCITNKIAQDGTNATNHEEVKQILDSKEVKKRIEGIVTDFFKFYK